MLPVLRCFSPFYFKTPGFLAGGFKLIVFQRFISGFTQKAVY